jgi:hypothetical protein
MHIYMKLSIDTQTDRETEIQKGAKFHRNVLTDCFMSYNLFQNQKSTMLNYVGRKKEIPRISFIFWIGPTSRKNLTLNC